MNALPRIGQSAALLIPQVLAGGAKALAKVQLLIGKANQFAAVAAAVVGQLRAFDPFLFSFR